MVGWIDHPSDRMKRSIAIFMVLILLGCLGQESPQPEGEFPKTIVDDTGKEVLIEEHPERIISLAPSNTEILYAIGVGEKIVGTTDYCTYPPDAVHTEKVGGFSDVNSEKVISLNPDIVVATSNHQEIAERLEELGIPVIILNPLTLDDILNNITLIGVAVGEEEAAQDLRADCEARIEAVKENAPSEPLTLYVEGWVSTSGYGSFGPGSFVDDLIFLAGGRNIAADADTSYPNISSETIIAENPVLIILVSGMGGVGIEEVVSRPGWDTIAAVKNNAIYVIDGDLVLRPGPRIVEGLEILAEFINNAVYESSEVFLPMWACA